MAIISDNQSAKPAIRTTEKQALLFYEEPFHAHPLPDKTLNEESLNATLPYGTLDMKYWYLDSIQIMHYRHKYKGHYLFKKENKGDKIGLEFNLKGNYLISHLGQDYRVKSRQHNMVYSPGFPNTFTNEDLETETFVIQFSPVYFLKIIEESNVLLEHFGQQIRSGKPAVLVKDSLLLNPDLHRAIQDIIHCRYSGGLKKIFLLSKSIEILVMQTDAYLRSLQTKDYHCTKTDKERILYAGEYLLEHLNNPPNLSGLAKIAGINEYKLKRGFKEVFQSTVFGYLASHRLEQASHMLLDTDKTAAEIAYELGYASPQHFNNAFKKKFKVTPGQFIKQ